MSQTKRRPEVPPRFDVILTDGERVARYCHVGYLARNRLVDFAFRHALRVSVTEFDPRPERRAYR